MKTIILHGWLGKEFGEEFKLQVRDTAEALRALCSQLPGFQKKVSEDVQGFRLYTGDTNVTRDTIGYPFSDREELHIIPVIAGSSKQGLGEILLGVALVALAFVTMGTSSIFTAEFIAGMSLSSLAFSIGTSLLLGGVSQLLFSPPKKKPATGANTPSYEFNGAVNTIYQGNPVPVLYGELVVGSQVVSAGFYVEAVSV